MTRKNKNTQEPYIIRIINSQTLSYPISSNFLSHNKFQSIIN